MRDRSGFVYLVNADQDDPTFLEPAQFSSRREAEEAIKELSASDAEQGLKPLTRIVVEWDPMQHTHDHVPVDDNDDNDPDFGVRFQ